MYLERVIDVARCYCSSLIVQVDLELSSYLEWGKKQYSSCRSNQCRDSFAPIFLCFIIMSYNASPGRKCSFILFSRNGISCRFIINEILNCIFSAPLTSSLFFDRRSSFAGGPPFINIYQLETRHYFSTQASSIITKW